MSSLASHQLVLHSRALAQTADFLLEGGFRIEAVIPAESPEVIVVSGFGLVLRLEQSETEDTRVELRLPQAALAGRSRVFAGVRLVPLTDADTEGGSLIVPTVVPKFELIVPDESAWVDGRAGMQYRDLIPSRLGGAFVASQIRVPGEGPVRDYVHHHGVRFQIIYCVRGWVRVVYEEQGEPFVLEAGDCVLQPPHIRHRVLESGEDLEVVEVSCPSRHVTLADYERPLPGPVVSGRVYGGQQFVRHVAKDAAWRRGELAGCEQRDTLVGSATHGLGEVVVLRACGGASSIGPVPGVCGLSFLHVLAGAAKAVVGGLEAGKRVEQVHRDHAITLPAGAECLFEDATSDFELLWVRVAVDATACAQETGTNSSQP